MTACCKLRAKRAERFAVRRCFRLNCSYTENFFCLSRLNDVINAKDKLFTGQFFRRVRHVFYFVA